MKKYVTDSKISYVMQRVGEDAVRAKDAARQPWFVVDGASDCLCGNIRTIFRDNKAYLSDFEEVWGPKEHAPLDKTNSDDHDTQNGMDGTTKNTVAGGIECHNTDADANNTAEASNTAEAADSEEKKETKAVVQRRPYVGGVYTDGTQQISSALALYRTISMFQCGLNVSHADFYKQNWMIVLQHRATGKQFGLGEWKGGFQIFTDAYKISDLPPIVVVDFCNLLSCLVRPDFPIGYDGTVAGSVA